MEDKNRLDDIIGNKLAHFEAPYQPSSWDVLQERLDTEAKRADAQFDEQIQRKMSDMEVPYQSFHWLMLSSLLDEKAALRRELICCKLSEVVLLLLLLFTFGQIPEVASSFYNSEQPVAQVTPSVSVGQIQFDPICRTAYDSLGSADNQMVAASASLHIPTVQKSQTASVIQTAFPTLPVGKVSPIKSETLAPMMPPISMKNTRHNDALVFPIATSSSALALLADASTVAAIQIPKIKAVKHKHLRMGMFTSVNLDNIKTPYDEVFNQAPYTRLAWQYGGGFSIGWLWKRMEIETGLTYGHKAYKPILNPVYYGNVNSGYKVEGIKNIELNTFQIPLNLRYTWWSKNGWQVYGLTGASVHVATQANYDVASLRASALDVRANPTTTGQSITLSPMQLDRFEREAQSSAPNSTKLKQKQFPDGWMNGGTFNENNYYTLNFGVGIERHLADRWSLFLQPTYKQHLGLMDKGIGPNFDKISTLEILLGAKVGL